MAICLFSLAGIPPLAGFWGKFALFRSALDAGLSEQSTPNGWYLALCVVGVLNAAIAAGYYLRLIAALYFQSAAEGTSEAPVVGNAGAGIATLMATFLVVIVLSKIQVLSRLAVLLGLAIGTIVALILGKVDVSTVGAAAPFAFPQPLAFGLPLFEIGAIVSMVIVILVIMVETTADILAVGEVVGTKVDARRVGDGLRADMGSSIVAPKSSSPPALRTTLSTTRLQAASVSHRT